MEKLTAIPTVSDPNQVPWKNCPEKRYGIDIT